MSLEGEAFLLGIWKNFQELEETLSVPELEAILQASRKKEAQQRRFAAGLKGIKLDDDEHTENQERLEAIKARVAAKLSGKSDEEVDSAEIEAFGIDVITE